jgi:hypothetical protein
MATPTCIALAFTLRIKKNRDVAYSGERGKRKTGIGAI